MSTRGSKLAAALPESGLALAPPPCLRVALGLRAPTGEKAEAEAVPLMGERGGNGERTRADTEGRVNMQVLQYSCGVRG